MTDWKIEVAEALVLKPGDRVLLTFDRMLSREQIDQAQDILRERFPGRDALVDAYQEAMDLVMYLRQMIEERAEAETRLRAQVLREAAERLDPGPRRPGTEAGFDRGVEAGKRGAASFLREWAGLVRHMREGSR